MSFPAGTRQHHQGIARFESQDGGLTWSKPTDLSESIYRQFDQSARGPVKAMFIGSGKIHQSRYTKVGDTYRLYCAVLVRDVDGTYCNYVLFSDDFGLSWSILGDADVPPIPSGADEPKTEELPDGSIVISSRCTGGRQYNIYTFTDSRRGEGMLPRTASWLHQTHATERYLSYRPGDGRTEGKSISYCNRCLSDQAAPT